MSKIPKIVPLYPYFGTVLFPKAVLPLVVSSPEEKSIIEAALRTEHRMIGVVQPLDETQDKLHKTGCLGKIISFHETDSGGMVVNIKGVCRFDVIQEEVSHASFRRVRIAPTLADLKDDKDPFVDRKSLISLLEEYLADSGLGVQMDELDDVSDEVLISSLAMTCPFDPAEKQAILEQESLGEQSELITTFIEMSNPGQKSRIITYH